MIWCIALFPVLDDETLTCIRTSLFSSTRTWLLPRMGMVVRKRNVMAFGLSHKSSAYVVPDLLIKVGRCE